jgi:hypothetical protein
MRRRADLPTGRRDYWCLTCAPALGVFFCLSYLYAFKALFVNVVFMEFHSNTI